MTCDTPLRPAPWPSAKPSDDREVARSHAGPDHCTLRPSGERIRQGFGLTRRGQHRCSHRAFGAGVGCGRPSRFGWPVAPVEYTRLVVSPGPVTGGVRDPQATGPDDRRLRL